jgi:general stress protein CsbA
VNSLPISLREALQSNTFLPNVIGPSFMKGLTYSIYIALILTVAGLIFSALMGGRYVHEEHYISKEMKENENK